MATIWERLEKAKTPSQQTTGTTEAAAGTTKATTPSGAGKKTGTGGGATKGVSAPVISKTEGGSVRERLARAKTGSTSLGASKTSTGARRDDAAIRRNYAALQEQKKEAASTSLGASKTSTGARRDDAAIRRRYAEAHPEETGGERGALTRQLNSAKVELATAREEKKTVGGKREALTPGGRTGLDRLGPLTGEYQEAVDAAETRFRAAKNRVMDLQQQMATLRAKEEWDAMPSDPEELRTEMDKARQTRDAARERMRQLTAGGRTGLDRLGDTGDEYSAEKAKADEADARLTALARKEYQLRNERAFAGLGENPTAAADYMGAQETRADQEKIRQVVLYYQTPGNMTADEVQAVQDAREDLERRYGVTENDFLAYVHPGDAGVPDTNPVKALYDRLDRQLTQQAGRLADSGYDYGDMSGYAQRAEEQAAAAARSEENQAWAKEHPVLSTAASAVAGLLQPADALKMDWGYGSPGDADYVPPDTSNMQVTELVNTVRGTVADQLERNTDWELWGQNLSSFLYQTGTSMADSALDIALLGPGSVYLMGGNAAVNGAKQIVDQGGTARQAFWGGLADGAAEIIFEKVSVDNLLKPKDIGSWRDLVRETLKQGGIEASEEVFTELANILSDTAIMGANSDYNRAVKAYQEEGMSAEEAKREAYKDQILQVVWAGAGGALSGIGMGGAHTGVAFARDTMAANALEREIGQLAEDGAIPEEAVQAVREMYGLEEPAAPDNAEEQAAPEEDTRDAANSEEDREQIAREQAIQRRIDALDAETVARGVADLGMQGQATIRSLFVPGQNTENYVRGMRALYEAGRTGAAVDTVADGDTVGLTETQQRSAYAAGVRDAALASAQTEGQAGQNTAQEDGEDYPFVWGDEGKGAAENEQGVRVRDGGQWVDGAGAEGTTGHVEEGAAGADAGADRTGPADAGASALQVGRAVSTRELGISDGVTGDAVRVVTGGETEETRAAREAATARGLALVLFTGGDLHVQTVDGEGQPVTVAARAYISGQTVYVRADHGEFTARQLYLHEEYHDMVAAGEADPRTTMEYVREQLGDEMTDVLEEVYKHALNGLTGVELWEEIAADQRGGMNIFAGTTYEGDMEGLGLLVGLAEENRDAKAAEEPSGSEDRGKTSQDVGTEGDYIKRMRELERENKNLRKRYEYWKKQTTRSKNRTVDHEAVKDVARYLLQSIGTRGVTIEEAAGKLQQIYDTIYTDLANWGGQIVDREYAIVREKAEDVARDLLSTAVERQDDTYNTYRELRAQIRGQQILISEADSRDIPDFNDWRARQFGRMPKMRKARAGEMGNVDAVYKELAGSWPELFDEAEYTVPSDQLLHIAEVAQEISRITEVNPYSPYMEEAVQWAANEILRAYDTLPLDKGTRADQWAEKLRQTREDGRARMREVVRYEKEKQAKRMREWYRNRDEQTRARKKELEERNRLLKILQRLDRMKTTKANKEKIRELMGNLDTVARSLVGKRRMNLEDLRRHYLDLSDPNSDVYDPDFIPDPATKKRLERLSRTHIDDMTLEDVRDLTKSLLDLEFQIRNDKRLLLEQEARTAYQLGLEVIDEMESLKGSPVLGPGAVVSKMLTNELLSPMRLMRKFTGWNDSNPLMRAMERLNDGQRAMLDYQMRATKPFEEFAKNEKFAREFSGPQAKEVKIGGWTKDGLVELPITPAMRVSIYLHSLNPQNARHMAEGGVTVPDMTLYRKGSLAEAYARGTTIKIKVSDTARMYRDMDEMERKFVRTVQRYFQDVSQPELSRVAEALRGYTPTMLENYYPITTDKNFMHQDITVDKDGTASVLKPGYMEERINASGPMMLQDADDAVDRAIQHHGLFVGLALPVRDFNKLWNVSVVGTTEKGEYYPYAGSVKSSVANTWGKSGQAAIESIIRDVQGQQLRKDEWGSFFAKIRSNYAGAVLTLNPSVAIKQTASFPTAAAVLGWRPLLRALTNVGKVDIELIKKYTPLLWQRSKGYSTQELGDMARNNKSLPVMLNWIQGMDLLTVKKLWKASEYYVRDNNKALQIGSDGYYRAVADIFNRVVEETQPNYTTMQRANILRSGSDLVRAVTMFKTQPIQNLNILYDAMGNYLAKRRQVKAGTLSKDALKLAGKNLANAVTSQLVQAGVFAGMSMAWAVLIGKAARYKDKDKDQLTAASIARAVGMDAMQNLLSGVPIVPDLAEYVAAKIKGDQAYGLEVSSLKLLTDVMDAVAKIVKLGWSDIAGGDRPSLERNARIVVEAGEVIGQAFGVPAKNVINLFEVVTRNGLVAILGKYEGGYWATRIFTDPKAYPADYYDLLYKAKTHDQDAYQTIYDNMIDAGFTPNKIKSAMETRMKKEQGVASVTDLSQRYLAPAMEEEYDRALSRAMVSSLWRKADKDERKEATDALYAYITRAGGGKAAEKFDALDAAGVRAEDWALYKLALEMYDEPTASGTLGSYTNDEVRAAIEAIPGLSAEERRTLWLAQGKAETSCPW